MSTGVSKIRATSRPTFPWPIIATDSTSRLSFKLTSSGNPLYQPTNCRADNTLGNDSPGMFRVRSCAVPYAWKDTVINARYRKDYFNDMLIIINADNAVIFTCIPDGEEAQSVNDLVMENKRHKNIIYKVNYGKV